MFTDTHCHITNNYYEDIDQIIENAFTKRITKMIDNGSDLKSNREVLDLAKKYKSLYPALGFHPEALDKFDPKDLNIIEKNIDKIVAIGEIGLDYHYDNADRDGQKRLLCLQLDIAKKYDKPVIIHSRDATEDTIEILKKYPTLKGSIHCFSGSLETAQIYIKMGFKLGFGGVTTFKNAKIKEVLKEVPNDAILLETDSPYLAPEPKRGTKNEPANIYHIAKFVANIKDMSLEELSEITENNVKELFDI